MGAGDRLMVTLYTGTPGSGKSMHIARVIQRHLRQGKMVVANFPVALDVVQGHRKNIGRYVYIPNDRLTPTALIDLARDYFDGKKIREGEIILVIDECQLLYNSRDWQKKGRDEWLLYYSQHRKYGYDVYLIAQYDGMVDKQIRAVVEYEVRHRKVSNYGIAGCIFSLLTAGNMHIAVRYWYPVQQYIDTDIYRADKRLYRLYDTWHDFGVPVSAGTP